jgi:hypothetical protein
MNRPTDLKAGALYRILWFDNTENILQYETREVFTYPHTPDKLFDHFWIVASKGGLNDRMATGIRSIESPDGSRATICPVWDRVLSCTILEMKDLPLFLDWDKGSLFESLLKGTA